MDNPFVGLKQVSAVEIASGPAVWNLSDKERRQKRDALYAKYTHLVFGVLNQLIIAYQPGVWKKGSDCNHDYCYHCRWYAGPEETGHAHYDDHPIRRRIEIELEVNAQCEPTGFEVMYHNNPNKCAHVGLSQEELVRGIKAVFI
jgi:hypothetical protein